LPQTLPAIEGVTMTKLHAALMLCLGLALSACFPPTTSHPIGTTVGIKNDAVLEGTWKTLPQPGGRGDGYYHFLPQAGGGFVVVVVPAHGPASDLIVATVSTARFGAFGFMNAKLANSDGRPVPGGPSGTTPLLYRFGPGGTLSLCIIDSDATKAAIRAHKIAGDAGKADSDDDAVITADPETLDRFFQSPAGHALFMKRWIVMRKVG
jgi:hypothetical protein